MARKLLPAKNIHFYNKTVILTTNENFIKEHRSKLLTPGNPGDPHYRPSGSCISKRRDADQTGNGCVDYFEISLYLVRRNVLDGLKRNDVLKLK